MKILVHICCAPDAVYFLKRLREDYPESDIVGFFYDPNIHPYEEYKLRLLETKRICKELGIELYEGEYDLEGWLSAVKGYEDEPERGKRCAICFDYRLLRSLEVAKELGATHLTTTLLMSPKKEFLMLKESGQKVCQNSGIEFLALDYRKGGGTQEMFRLSKELELYHQDYCGCIYGLFKQKKGPVQWDLVSFGGRRPGSKEELTFIKEIRLFVQGELNLSCREWEFGFLNWKVLQGKLEVNGQTIPSFVRPYSPSIRGILKADPVEKIGRVIYYNKGGLRVILTEGLRDEALEYPDNLCNPTFLVPREYEESLLRNRVSAELQTEISPDKSLILLIGSLDAEDIAYLPADTLQDGTGISLEWLKEFLRKEQRDIALGRKAYLLVGASTLGNPGVRYFEERTGKKVRSFLCSQTS
ncbi:MAG: epoxyqueuosine reductase QueH [Aquificaceae bacterium]